MVKWVPRGTGTTTSNSGLEKPPRKSSRMARHQVAGLFACPEPIRASPRGRPMTAPPITLSSPAEMLAVNPHLLGFEPRHAIVVVALQDNKIGLTQRMDLPEAD